MKIEDFRPVMLRVLSDSIGKKLKVEEVVDRMIIRMQDVESVMSSMGGVAITPAPALPTPAPVASQTDISQKLTSDKVNDGGLVEVWTKEQLSAFARDQMPSLLSVQPAGFDAPFQIQKFVESAPGDLGFMRITYQQPGAPMTDQSGQRVGPTVQISTTDKRLDADELTIDIVKQAQSMYTKTPRVLVPKLPPTQGRPGDLTNAIFAEAPGTGEEGMTMPLSPDMSNQWRAQRQRGTGE